YYPADEEKIPLLLGLLSRSEGARTMVFVNTKAFVERVARALERAGYRVGVLSGDVPQKKRESLLKKFQAGQLELLVATDVAARGLHIDGVSHVYNFDLPFDAEDYVHRIGRTARLGAEGDAISFACERYAMSLPDIETYIEQKIPSEPVTRELLTALPRKPREGVEEQAEDGESIGEIFKEAREQRAADEQRRGGGSRSGGPRRGASGERRPGESRGPRPPRKSDEARPPRPPRVTDPVAPVAASAVAAAEPKAEGAPRKRRRRRGGRRIEGAEALPMPSQQAPQQTRQVAAKSAAKPAAGEVAPSLLARIGKSIKALVTRAPRSTH
ncbi:MAG TPA: ATP-dependent RNA helicase RhlB, partial [Lysobacter sp.]|nr:ATP-dependent RNA helicase RhlB [Lysobacter sp.]